MMSKIISDEEIMILHNNVVDKLEIENPNATDDQIALASLKAIAEAQRDASDQEWVEWVKEHRWEIKSLIPGIDTIKGYLIKDEELQAIREENEQRKRNYP